MQTFVARQPIFDRKLNVFGYELLFRAGAEALTCTEDPARASRKVIADTLMVLGYDTVTSGRRAFVNITRGVLLEGHHALLPPENTVLEILENVPPDEEVLTALREVREAGYRIALDDFVPGVGWESAMDLVDFLKVDVLALPMKRVVELGKQYRDRGPILLAEKVEDRETLERVREAGYKYFQGYFFARPVTTARRDIPASKLSLLRLLEQIHRPELDLDAIEETIEQELSFSYKLLRFLGSAYFGWRQPVASIRHAMMLLGEREFRRWASVVALAGMATDKPEEVVTQAVVCARYCQEVATAARLQSDASDYFLLGLFSLLDVILDRPLDEILETVAIEDEVKEALLGAPGPMRTVLDLALGHLHSDWAAVDTGCETLGVEPAALPPLFGNARQYTNGALGREANRPAA